MIATTIDIAGLEMVYAANLDVPEDRFDMTCWRRKIRHLNEPCGTAGCLIGNFCAKHPQDALKLGFEDGIGGILQPIMDGFNGTDAIAKRFNMRIADAYCLFVPEGEYVTKQEALDNLRDFIDDHK